MNISVIGGGAWGTALALLIKKKGHDVMLWVREKEVVEEILTQHTNPFLRGIPLDPKITATSELAEAAEFGEWLILAVPSHGMRSVIKQLGPLIENKPILSVTKGIELGTNLRMSQVVREVVGKNDYAALSGPSFAHEVAHSKPTAVVVASENSHWAEMIQKNLSGPTLRLYTSNDVIGVELGGSVKNIMAIAAGVSDGLELGENARAGLITRGLAEMVRLGEKLGGKRETFFGLSGLGDLVLTCSGKQSRNHQVGERIAKGESLSEIVKSMKAVAEGVHNTECFYQIVSQQNIDAPLIRTTYAMLYEGIKPLQALENLMGRDLKKEA